MGNKFLDFILIPIPLISCILFPLTDRYGFGSSVSQYCSCRTHIWTDNGVQGKLLLTYDNWYGNTNVLFLHGYLFNVGLLAYGCFYCGRNLYLWGNKSIRRKPPIYRNHRPNLCRNPRTNIFQIMMQYVKSMSILS